MTVSPTVKRNADRFMKTALYITDCTVDSALTLQNWLSAHPRQPVRLTIVLPYDIEEGDTLDKKTLQSARAAAVEQLKNWTALMNVSSVGTFTAETLLASPALAASIHLLIRRYDYWFVDDWAMVTEPALSSILNQPAVQTLPLAINAPLWAVTA